MKTNLLEKTPAQIATEYRALLAHVRTQPAETRWTYGTQLKTLKAAFQVTKEAQQVRSK